MHWTDGGLVDLEQVELTSMAVAALEQVLAWGPSRIAAALAAVTAGIADVDRLVTTLVASV